MNWIVLSINLLGIWGGIGFGYACRHSLPNNRLGGLILLVLLCASLWAWSIAFGYMHNPDFSISTCINIFKIYSEKDSSPRGGMFVGLNLYMLYALLESVTQKFKKTANKAVVGTLPRGRGNAPHR